MDKTQIIFSIQSCIEVVVYALTAGEIICCKIKEDESRAKFLLYFVLQCEIIVGRLSYLAVEILYGYGTESVDRTIGMLIATITVPVAAFVAWHSRNLLRSRMDRKKTESDIA